jgi:hypothetical protein
MKYFFDETVILQFLMCKREVELSYQMVQLLNLVLFRLPTVINFPFSAKFLPKILTNNKRLKDFETFASFIPVYPMELKPCSVTELLIPKNPMIFSILMVFGGKMMS